jgi:hypothetical protein
LNRRFRIEIPVSEMTPPLREAAPGPAGGAVGEHDNRTNPAAAVAATTADRDLSRLHQPTRIPTRFLSPPIQTCLPVRRLRHRQTLHTRSHYLNQQE